MTSPTTRALIIPAEVLALPSDTLTWAARLVLAEIIDLYKPHHHVYARNDHFEKRCLLKARTVEDAMKQLADAGLIQRVVDQRLPDDRRRTIIPTVPGLLFGPPTADSAVGDKVPATAESAVGNENDPRPTADSAVAPPDLPQNLRQPTAESAADLPQNLRQPTAKSAVINTNINTKGKYQVNPVSAAASPAGHTPGVGKESEVPAELPTSSEVPQEVPADQERYQKWQTWAREHAPRVLKMKVPLTAPNLSKLVDRWGVKLLESVFEGMDNHGPLISKNVSAYKTADAWCRLRTERAQATTRKPNGLPVTPTRTSDDTAALIRRQQTKEIE